MCNNSRITWPICMKLTEIIFCWINLPIWYQTCIDDVIFTEFLWYEILSIYRFLWKSNDSKWRHFRSILPPKNYKLKILAWAFRLIKSFEISTYRVHVTSSKKYPTFKFSNWKVLENERAWDLKKSALD